MQHITSALFPEELFCPLLWENAILAYFYIGCRNWHVRRVDLTRRNTGTSVFILLYRKSRKSLFHGFMRRIRILRNLILDAKNEKHVTSNECGVTSTAIVHFSTISWKNFVLGNLILDAKNEFHVTCTACGVTSTPKVHFISKKLDFIFEGFMGEFYPWAFLY